MLRWNMFDGKKLVRFGEYIYMRKTAAAHVGPHGAVFIFNGVDLSKVVLERPKVSEGEGLPVQSVQRI